MGKLTALFVIATATLLTSRPILAQEGDSHILRHDSDALYAIWNVDETRVMSWSRDDLRIWDARTGETLLVMPHSWSAWGVWGARWNADETHILSWSNDGSVRVWDVGGA